MRQEIKCSMLLSLVAQEDVIVLSVSPFACFGWFIP